LASIVLRKKNEIDIVLDGEADFVHSYSTFDEIKGRVDLKFEKDVQIDELMITFEGHSATYVEKIATTAPTTGRTTGKHTFLKLLQPVDSDQLPECNLMQANVTYSVPFTFTVPDRLLPYICSHKVENEDNRIEHTQLPPSLGDPATSGDGHILMDDFAPAMARITYAIRARATTRLATGKIIDLAERIERVRIVPQKQEEPPREPAEGSDYALRKEKPVKKGLFKLGKVGRISAETVQPKSLRLPHPQKRISDSEPVSTVATVNLRFDPATLDDQPPQLGSINTKLRIYTFFGAAPYRVLPEVFRCDNWSNLHGLYPESIDLSSRNLSTVTWTKHQPGTLSTTSSREDSDISRRPSTFSTGSSATIPDSTEVYNPDFPFYTANVVVPISLPNPYTSKNPKVFVPSFHSCIISRTYTLELMINYRSPSANVTSPHITLKSPLQISAEGSRPRVVDPESDEALVAEIERQFGIYEARQIQDALALEVPSYEDDSAPLLSSERRQTFAAPSMVAGGAPPEYHADGGIQRRVGGPRTQSVSVLLFA
jgi:hypothetical protein